MKLDAVHRISSGFCENRIPDLMEKHKRLTITGYHPDFAKIVFLT